MKKASMVMIIGSLALLGLFVFPLWNIMLGAPQYPDPLGLNIHINGLSGVKEFDIKNIDGLNHYIGMQPLPKEGEFWEFSVFPKVVIAMAALGALIGLLAMKGVLTRRWFLAWFVTMSILGILGMYDFNQWLTEYGSDLDKHAILKLTNPDGTPMVYKPPLLGYKKLLNFDVTSMPHIGAYLMFAGMGLSVIAFYMGKKT